MKHLAESEQGDFFDKTDFSNIDDYIKDIIGEAQLLNIDISNLDDTATEVVTKVFSKMLFDYLRSLTPRNSMPINLILEEAHRFVRCRDFAVLVMRENAFSGKTALRSSYRKRNLGIEHADVFSHR